MNEDGKNLYEKPDKKGVNKKFAHIRNMSECVQDYVFLYDL